jgi:hypothetical protein
VGFLVSRRKDRGDRRKNPPRIAADGFWAKQITLIKTPPLTGPVKRGSIFLSTGGGQLRIGE